MNLMDDRLLTGASEKSLYRKKARARTSRLLHEMPQQALKAIEGHFRNPEQSPSSKIMAAALSGMLSEYTGLPESTIRIFAGRAAIFDAIVDTFLRPHNKALIAGPIDNYFEKQAENREAKIKCHYGPSPFSADPDGIVKEADENTAVVYLPNPNPLTGVVYSLEEIRFILEHLPDNMVVVDERYCEYHGFSSAELVRRHSNLIVIRSLLEGMIHEEYLCTYILSSPANLSDITECNALHGPSSVSQIAAIATLKSLDFMLRQIDRIRENMISLSTKLRRFGILCRLTPIDRLLVKLADPEKASDFLNSRDILTEDISHYHQLENYISLYVGDDSYSESILQAFEEMPESYLRTESVGQSKITLHRHSETDYGIF